MKLLCPVASILTFVLVLFVLLGLQGHVVAAPNANLLKGHNPSFEQGMAEWFILHFPGYAPKIVAKSAGPKCGTKALRFKYTSGDTLAAASSTGVPMGILQQYRFVIWLRIKGEADVQISAEAHEVGNLENIKSIVLFNDITTTDGHWKRFAGTFTSMPVVNEGRINVLHKSGTGTLFVDCAAIKPIP